MKIGFKGYASNPFPVIQETFDHGFDFAEITIDKRIDFQALKDLGRPFNVHCRHSDFSVNFADPKNTKNGKALDDAIFAADLLNAQFIVCHAGQYENKDCSLANAIEFLQDRDERILIETVPIVNYAKNGMAFEYCFAGATLMELQAVKKAGIGICLDNGHVAFTAKTFGLDYLALYKKYIKELKPEYYHLVNARFTDWRENLHLSDGVLDIRKTLAAIPENKDVLIEVPKGMALREDLDIVKTLRRGKK